MSKITGRLAKFIVWLTHERFAAFASIWYATYIFQGKCFTSSGWVALQRIADPLKFSPEALLALILYSGAGCTLWGMWKDQTFWRLMGAFFGFFGFTLLTVSQVAHSVHSAGIPSYSIFAVSYLLSMLRRSTNVEWVPFTQNLE
jgi:hypothetical protein